MISALWVVLCMAVASANPGDGRSGEPGHGGIGAHVAQAQHFLKRGWTEDAAEELRVALSLPGADTHFAVHWIGADIAWELDDVGWSEQLLSAALNLAPDAVTRKTVSDQLSGLRSQYGYIRIEGAQGSVQTRIQLERTDLELDATKKRMINRVGLTLREPQTLPQRVGLPRGRYLVNGKAVEVHGGQETTVALARPSLGTRGLAALQVARPELDMGVGLLLGTTKGGRQPDVRLRLVWNQPLGRLFVGGMVEGRTQTWLGPDDQGKTGFRPTGGGIRLGTEIFSASVVAVQPGIQLAANHIAGLPGGSGEPGGGPYALEPGADLTFAVREGGRTTSLGTGVRLAAHGVLPLGDSVTWSGIAVAILGHSSLVF